MRTLQAFIGFLQARRGFSGFCLATCLGALAVLGHAPFHIWPAFAVSISGLLLLCDGASVRAHPIRSGFAVAWAWAFGYFAAGMFWVGNAFLVDADKFALLLPLAVTALPAGLALFWGAAGAIALAFWRPDTSRLLILTLALSLAEFGRGHLFTGLPWNLPSYIWLPGNTISQAGALIGPYGLTLLTFLVLASPALLVQGPACPHRKPLFLALGALIVGIIGYGNMRLNEAGPIDPMAGSGPIIAAGQGGFSQKEVWDPSKTEQVTQTYLDMLDTPNAQNADIIIWPEAAFPFLMLEHSEVLAGIERKIGRRTLVVGSIRRTSTLNGDAYGNSVLVMNTRGGSLKVTSSYDKYHLVPFGEYLPLRPLFKALGIASLVAYDGEISPGPSPMNLAVPGAPIADPRVCYEIVFPNFNPKAIGIAGWILNISIDAWYGDLLGPDQHFAQARARAIETGMPLVRAASGGWSAVVDRYGRPLATHRKGAGYAYARLPLDAEPTLYSRFGENLFLYLIFGLSFVILFCRKSFLTVPTK